MKFKTNCHRCFAALSVEARVKIIQLLQEREKMSVLEIAKSFQLKQPTITHHLSYLKKAGILESKKDGRKVFYYIRPLCQENTCRIFSLT